MNQKDFPVKSDSFLALRYKDFRFWLYVNFLLTFAFLIQEVIIGYELYRITHDPMAIGMVGLAEAIPFILLSIFGGHFADKLSKKKLMMAMIFLSAFASVFLFFMSMRLLSTADAEDLKYVIWAVMFFIGTCRAFFSPASGALKAFLVPKEAYANSSAWSSSSWQTASIAGPGISGFLYSIFGFSNTLLFVVGLIIVSLFFMSRVKDSKIEESSGSSMLTLIKEGFSYTYRTKIIFYSISLDMFSVMFGGVIAILPVFAQDILHVGPEGLGILRMSPSIGAVIVLMFLTKHPPAKNPWRILLLAVAGFGIATLVFAVSQNFYLSAAALFLTGSFDSISVVIRNMVLQFMVPDNMRGRVNAINGIFISTSNEVGAFESGLAAKLLGTVPSVIFGGAMTLIVTAYIYFRSKELFKIKF